MPRHSEKSPNILDSMARLLNRSQNDCTAIAYHNTKFYVASNVKESRPDVEARLPAFAKIFQDHKTASSPQLLRDDILMRIHLKDHKIPLFQEVIIPIYGRQPTEVSRFDEFKKFITILNAYQNIAAYVKPTKGAPNIGYNKDITLQELMDKYSAAKAIEKEKYKLNAYNAASPEGKGLTQASYDIIKEWYDSGRIAPISEDWCRGYITSWCNSAFDMRSTIRRQDSYDSASSKYSNMNIFSRPVIDAERVAHEFFANSPTYNIRGAEFELVYGKDNSHAEMQILDRLFSEIRVRDEIYIGISRLCCSGCAVVIENFGEIIPHAKINVKGAHYRPYADGWSLPEFVKSSPEYMRVLIHSMLKEGATFCNNITAKREKGTDSDNTFYEQGDLSDCEDILPSFDHTSGSGAGAAAGSGGGIAVALTGAGSAVERGLSEVRGDDV